MDSHFIQNISLKQLFNKNKHLSVFNIELVQSNTTLLPIDIFLQKHLNY